MKAVILAAGMGTRLEELTFGKPKCLVRLNGKALLDYQLQSLLKLPLDEIILVVGYQAEKVVAHIEEHYPQEHRIHCIESTDFASTNNMFSLSLARERLAGNPFLLLNADVVFDPSILSDLCRHDGCAVAVDVDSYAEESMKVAVATDGSVCAMSKQLSQDEALGCSIDLYRIDGAGSFALFSEVAQTVARGELNEWTEVALDRLAADSRLNLRVLPTDNRPWYEIDSLEDLRAAEALFGRQQIDWSRFDVAFLDMDGTLCRGEESIPGTARFFSRLSHHVPHVYVLSNNSSRSHDHYVDKLKQAGVEIDPSHILLSTDALTAFLRRRRLSRVYAVGTHQFRELLSSHGIEQDDTSPEAVVLGYDTELTYEKLRTAALLLQDPHLPYYATHSDKVCPSTQGMVPDIGSMISLLETATGRLPDATFGKPDMGMVQHVLDSHRTTPERAVFFGDRIETDYAMATRCGSRFVGLLSGDAQRADYEDCSNLVIFPSVAEVFERARG